jgi:peptidoglycan/xylan/chitin deacetylase (PgdA/CDA1 family)
LQKICAVSIDIDEIPHYFDIHGLPRPSKAAHAAYDHALPRAAAFAASRNLPLTLFAVGQDLERPENACLLKSLVAKGHAVENHSHGHRYDLTRLAPHAIRDQIEQSAQAIKRATGHRPTGFRAPGYTVNERVFDALDDIGVDYDSSVFPCPSYYLAKAFAMAGMRLRGRMSRSVLDTPRVLGAPRRPYRPGSVWYRPAARGKVARRFVELPIQVTPGLRFPFIGTLLGIAGARGAAALARSCVGEALINLEMHAIDFLDAGDGVEELVGHQPELWAPVAGRLDALAAALDVFARAGYAFVRLDEAAHRVYC